MSLIQKEAPNFEAEALYPDGMMQPLNLYDYRGKYVVLFFYPMDFTFVCPTEIIAFSDRISEFRQRGVEVLGSQWIVSTHISHGVTCHAVRVELATLLTHSSPI